MLPIAYEYINQKLGEVSIPFFTVVDDFSGKVEVQAVQLLLPLWVSYAKKFL